LKGIVLNVSIINGNILITDIVTETYGTGNLNSEQPLNANLYNLDTITDSNGFYKLNNSLGLEQPYLTTSEEMRIVVPEEGLNSEISKNRIFIF
jgi:hypothetical protein